MIPIIILYLIIGFLVLSVIAYENIKGVDIWLFSFLAWPLVIVFYTLDVYFTWLGGLKKLRSEKRDKELR